MKKTIGAVAVVLMVVAVSLSVIILGDQSSDVDQQPDADLIITEVPSLYKEKGVLVLGADYTFIGGEERSEITDVLERYTSNMVGSSDGDTITDQEIIIIDAHWLYATGDLTANNIIAKNIEKNKPVILVGETPKGSDPLLNDIYNFRTDGSVLYCVYRTVDGAEYYYNVAEGVDIKKAIEVAYLWACFVSSGTTPEKSLKTPWLNVIHPEPIKGSDASEQKEHGAALGAGDSYVRPYWSAPISNGNYFTNSWGAINLQVNYFTLLYDGIVGHNYFAVHYAVTSIPTYGHRTADIVVRSNKEQSGTTITEYGPHTTYGPDATDAWVYIDLPAWSYGIPDVDVRNQSNPGTPMFKIWHDVDETKATGKKAYTVEPGKRVQTAMTGYSTTDWADVTFCRAERVPTISIGGYEAMWKDVYTDYTTFSVPLFTYLGPTLSYGK